MSSYSQECGWEGDRYVNKLVNVFVGGIMEKVVKSVYIRVQIRLNATSRIEVPVEPLSF